MAKDRGISIKLLSKGKAVSASIVGGKVSNFKNKLDSLPEEVFASIPKTFYATISTKVRKLWKQNYADKTFWKQKSSSSTGSIAEKRRSIKRGDSFKLAPSSGTLKAIGPASNFGIRTGNLYNNISTAKATTATVRLNRDTKSGKTSSSKSFNASIQTGLNMDVFEGSDNIRIHGITGKENPVSRPSGGKNYAEWFAKRISSDGTPRVFTRLSKQQLESIREYINNNFGLKAKTLIQTELRKAKKI